MKCKECGNEMVRDGSTTITGRKYTDYRCPVCRNMVHDVDEGIAVWKAYELADEDETETGNGTDSDEE